MTVRQEMQQNEGISMTMRDAYLQSVQAQLERWRATMEAIKLEAVKPETRNLYYQLQTLCSRHEALQWKLQEMSLAGPEKWDSLKAGIDRALLELQQEFNRLIFMLHEARTGSIGWAEGLAESQVEDSLGWSEGLANHQVADSIGWAEGQAGERIADSAGWAEGFQSEED